jgi:AP-4 complex subunit mu-1
MYSEFYVLSPRGDTIISKRYRRDVPKGSSEIFFRKVKFWEGDPPPAFIIDGTSYIFVKKASLYFVVTTQFNVSPSLAVELLHRIARVIKDYCGVLNEEAIRKNFILVYELVDEMLDYGIPQATSTETLKMYVHNTPVAVSKPVAQSFSKKLGLGGTRSTRPPGAIQQPISLSITGKKKNEVYVDILERLSVVFNSGGYVMNSSIDGSIQMKSYLSGNPALRLALNDDLVVGSDGKRGYGGVVLDDANFHEVVNLEEFESSRALSLTPPDGEFTVMNYRISGDFRTPFRVFPLIEEVSPYRIELVLKVRADIPSKNYGSNVVVRFPVPKTASTVKPEVGAAAMSSTRSHAGGGAGAGAGAGQSAEYIAKDREVVWRINKITGGSELTLRTKINLSTAATASVRRELGPISMGFEIPMYNVSNLQVKYLRILESSSYKPARWVRYVTLSHSYVIRL